MLYLSCPYTLRPSEVTWRQFSYISILPLCKGILGTEECAPQWVGWSECWRVSTSRKDPQTMKDRSWWSFPISEIILEWVLCGFSVGIPTRLSSSHPQWCVSITCPPFPVSLLLSLTLFPGITFQKTKTKQRKTSRNHTQILDLGAALGYPKLRLLLSHQEIRLNNRDIITPF